MYDARKAGLEKREAAAGNTCGKINHNGSLWFLSLVPTYTKNILGGFELHGGTQCVERKVLRCHCKFCLDLQACYLLMQICLGCTTKHLSFCSENLWPFIRKLNLIPKCKTKPIYHLWVAGSLLSFWILDQIFRFYHTAVCTCLTCGLNKPLMLKKKKRLEHYYWHMTLPCDWVWPYWPAAKTPPPNDITMHMMVKLLFGIVLLHFHTQEEAEMHFPSLFTSEVEARLMSARDNDSVFGDEMLKLTVMITIAFRCFYSGNMKRKFTFCIY